MVFSIRIETCINLKKTEDFLQVQYHIKLKGHPKVTGNITYFLVHPQSAMDWATGVQVHKCHQRIQVTLPNIDSHYLVGIIKK